MSDNEYSFTGLHLPENKILTGRLKRVSLLLSLLTAGMSLVALLFWILRLDVPFFPSPLVALAALFAAGSLFLQPKPTIHVAKPITLQQRLGPIFCASAVLGIGIFLIYLQSGLVIGGSIILFGIALLISQTKIVHRFHLIQFLTMLNTVFPSVTILGTLYQSVTKISASHMLFIPVGSAILFLFLSYAILFTWTNRGFFGIFTIDSLSSMLALRILIISMFIAPFLGLLSLIFAQKSGYTSSEVIAVLLILLTAVSCLLAWFNTKSLYTFETEHFMMKEALRVHNIDLKMSNEDLTAHMGDLEKTKQQYAESLNYQDKFRDLTENLG